MDSEQDTPGSDNLTVAFKKKKRKHAPKIHKYTKCTKCKIDLVIERLKRERELKSTMSGKKFRAFKIRLRKRFAVCVKDILE